MKKIQLLCAIGLLAITPQLYAREWKLDQWTNGSLTTTTASASNIMSVACSASEDHFKLHMAFMPTSIPVMVPTDFSVRIVVDDLLAFNLKTRTATNSSEIMFYDVRDFDVPLLTSLRRGDSARIEASFGDRIYVEELPLKNSGRTIAQVVQECRPQEKRLQTRAMKKQTRTTTPTKPARVKTPEMPSETTILLAQQAELVKEAQRRTLWYIDLDAEVVKDEDLSHLEALLEGEPETYK